MRSKWLWAALALVAVLGITTVASATTSGLITGKQIAPHSINSKKLVNHTIQKHDLSGALVKSLHGHRGVPGATGPEGPAGPKGATGAVGQQGPSGVVTTKAFAGDFGDAIGTGWAQWALVGPTVSVTTNATQKLVGSAVAVIGSTEGAHFWFGLCYQHYVSPSDWWTENFAGWDILEADTMATPMPYAAAASVTPGAGTWNVGYCVYDMGPGSLDDNDYVNGWVQVVN